VLKSGLSKALLSALIGLLFVVSPAFAKGRYSHYALGDLAAATPSPVSGGLLLMGGGDRNHDAMRWFFGKAGNGHIVILRASLGPGDRRGVLTTRYRRHRSLTETFVFHGSRRPADGPERSSTGLKQCRRHLHRGRRPGALRALLAAAPRWSDILNAHVAAGKPLAGTSAGLAIHGEQLYGAMADGSIKSPEALADPVRRRPTRSRATFLHLVAAQGRRHRHAFQGARPPRAPVRLPRQGAGRPPRRPACRCSASASMKAPRSRSSPTAARASMRPRPTAARGSSTAAALRGLAHRRPARTRRASSVDGRRPRLGRSTCPRAQVDEPHLHARNYAARGGEISRGAALVARHPRRRRGHRARGAHARKGDAAYRAGLDAALQRGRRGPRQGRRGARRRRRRGARARGQSAVQRRPRRGVHRRGPATSSTPPSWTAGRSRPARSRASRARATRSISRAP
jgi:beta-aspartyl-peptidase (threonine type)